ncbi:swt1 RNA endoribonuclease isoform X2 [Cotesia typhae]|uniref:swt1 RNA endoribonuclease isoform X2 n=1 Tax=Cotesia typhae TaxID=2053667 RepID=UPI003D698DC4
MTHRIYQRFVHNFSLHQIMAKINLPKDWILVTSTTDPGRNYYFNTATNKSTWIFPNDNSDSQPTQNTRKNSTRKRKKNEEHDYRPHTPEGDPEVNRRPKLKAKRQLSTSEDSGKKKPADTPQMKALREKMLQRQAKTSAIKKPRPLKSSTVKASSSNDVDKVDGVDKAKVEKTPEKLRKNFKFDDLEEEKTMTPAMKQLKSKMLARKSLSAIADRKKGKSSPKFQSGHLSLASTSKSASEDTVSSSTASTSTAAAQSEAKVQGLDSPRTRVSRSLSCSTTPRRKSGKVAIESKLKQMKTLEAPPGVSAKRVLVSDDSAELVKDDDSWTSPVSNAKIPRIGKLKAKESPEEDAKDPPVVFKNAEDRMKAFCSNLESQRSLSSSFNDSGSSTAKDSGEVFCEEMDWEPSKEEKIVSEIQNVRAQLVIEDDVHMLELNNTGLDLTDSGSESNGSLRKLYIVVDTNVFLSNMIAIEEARDAIFKFYNRPIIVIPWTVIRELDFIKDDKSHSRPQSLKFRARHAIQFINKHFAAKHPRILGQTFADVFSNRQKFETECPDDEILQTCLQIQSAGHHVVLLSYDKNLCNKAMIHDVISLGKNDPLEKVDYLKESEIKKQFSLADSLKDVEQEEKAELLLAEELFEDLKTTLTSFMSVVVAKEMKNLYGETWERHTIIQPPWTVQTVLKCASKHWIAAVSDSFERRAESILKDLTQIVTGLQYSCQLKDIETLIHQFHDLVGCLKSVKYPNILENVTEAIEAVKQKFRDSLKLIYRNKKDNKQEEESKAALLAFGYFETVYLFARDVCGTSASLMGMPFGLAFKKLESLSIEDNIKQLRPEVAGNLNRLMQILSTALDDIDHLHVDHPSVLALHQVLTGFLPEFLKSDHQLMPQDVFLCLKYKQEVLRNGLGQLQELSEYFCRMATFKCL